MPWLYENQWIYIEQESAEIPWLKIFAKESAKELTDCITDTQKEIFRVLLILEKAMIETFQPDKINIASFANYLPQVHWHIMARFNNDTHFPEPMWGKQQRESNLVMPNYDDFLAHIPRLLVNPKPSTA